MKMSNQRGFLRIENRKAGKTWVWRYYVTRAKDGRRVENTLAIGLASIYRSEASVWAEIDRQHLHRQLSHNNTAEHRKVRVLFRDLSRHFLQYEVPRRAPTTQQQYIHIIRHYLEPRWGDEIALNIEPLSIESWLDYLRDEKGLANCTRSKMRQLMHLIYEHGAKYKQIPASEANPVKLVRCSNKTRYEAISLSPGQVLQMMEGLPPLPLTITWLASGTGLRISEILGLRWSDLDWDHCRIHVRRTFIHKLVGKPKNEASANPVPMGVPLANIMKAWRAETPYPADTDWVFASPYKQGKQPWTGNLLSHKYLRSAAIRLGILVAKDPRRLGWHNLRHSLSSFLVTQTSTDPKTVQSILRHSDVSTTLALYTHAGMAGRIIAQNKMLRAIEGVTDELIA
jgi:integrase